MERQTIGELEELVLLATGTLREEAYAVEIVRILRENTSRSPDVTAVHAVLRRLEKKGFLKSEMGGATAERGGRRKRFYTITRAGRSVLDDTMEQRSRLYNMLPDLSFSSI